MRRVILAAAAALMALSACRMRAPEPEAGPSLRQAGAMISSAVLFDPARFAGQWFVAASGVPGCAGAGQEWRWDGQGGFALSGIDCGAGGKPRYLTGRAVLTGPGGRLTPDEGFGRAPIWVLWVDQDYRMAVLGTPGGQFGMVLSRELPPRADLMRAAQEVLDFNGYSPARIGR